MNRYRAYMNRIHAPSGLRHRVLESAERGQRPRRPARRWIGAGALAACFALAFFGGWQAWRYAAHYQPDPTAGVADPPAVITPAPAETEHTLVVGDPFDGQPHGFFAVPALEFADVTDCSPYLIDWDWKGDASVLPLTPQEIITVLGGEDEVPWSLLWSGFGLDGTVTHGEDGRVLLASVTGENGDTSFTLELSPGQLPPGGESYPDAAVQDYDGVAVTAWYTRPDGDGGPNYTYCVEFLSGDMGVRFTCDSPDQETASWLSCVLVRYAAQADGGFTTEHLVPGEIPAAGEELTLADVRDNDLNSWLPPADALPAGFTFEGGRAEQNWGEQSLLSAVWNRGEDSISVTVRRSAGGGDYPEADLALEDVTASALQGLGRQYAGDDALWQWSSLAVDWGDGVLVEYSLRGLTLEEALGLILGTPGRASTSIVEFPATERDPWTVPNPMPDPSPWQVFPLQ